MMRRFLFPAALAILLVSIGCSGSGGSGAPSTVSTETEPNGLSDPGQASFDAEKHIVGQILSDISDGHTKLSFYSFANKPVHHLLPIDIDDEQDLERPAQEANERRKSMTPADAGTFFVPMFKKLLEEAEASPVPVFCVVGTDGGVDDPDLDQLTEVCSDLAKLPQVKGVLIGPIATENVDTDTKVFAPLQSAGKLFCIGANSARGQVLDDFESRIQAGKPRLILAAVDVSMSTATQIKKEED